MEMKTERTDGKLEDLTELRLEISAVDDAMAALFVKRMEVSEKIAAYKEANGLPTYDPKREQENLKKAKTRVPEELRELYRKFLQESMNLSKEYQEMKRQKPEEQNA